MERPSERLHEAALALVEVDTSSPAARPRPALELVPPAPAKPKAKEGHGHRARLRRRLLEGGPDALAEHEIVEYLLALVVPRIDTKPLAKRLLKDFGGLGGLLAADARTIVRKGRISEASAAALKIVQGAAERLLEQKIDRKAVLGSWQALIDYLRASMGHLPIEQVRVLYLNTRNELIRDEVLSEGSIDESAVYVREVMAHAIDHGAAALILVHNHPSGDPSPSGQDIRLTRDLIEALRHLKIDLHDHVIVGAQGHASLRSMGLI
ncbi:MAG: RadC family protein [Sphingosinicella sp.]